MSLSTPKPAEPPLQLLREINDLLPAYVAYVDRDLRYVAANQMYMERFGRPEQNIVGQLVSNVTGSAFDSVAHHLRAALGGETQHLEPRMISVDGPRTLSVTHLPHRDETGVVQGVIVYGYDITEQRRAEAALLQSEKLAAVGRLASSIAHEINNPLQSVFDLLYLADTGIDEDPVKAREFLQLAQQELSRVGQITTQTLRFFKQSTSRRSIKVGELIDSVLALYNRKLVNSSIHVTREWDAVDAICLDGELRQAVSNLVGNAIDAMRLGGSLTLRVRQATDYTSNRKGIRITVADTGSGMDAATQQRIFEPFFTTKGISGTGLGLWIAREFVTAEEGALTVRSRVQNDEAKPHGTVFAIFLPHSTTSTPTSG